MSYQALLSTPCTIYRRGRPGPVNEYGDRPETEAAGEPAKCELQRVRAVERTQSGGLVRRLSETAYHLFLAPEVGLDATDQVDVGGQRYTVDGDPWQVTHPRTGEVHHLEARVRRVA